MIRLLTAVALLLAIAPASVAAHDPVPLPAPMVIECPMPELIMNGSIDPATVDPRCFTSIAISGRSQVESITKMPVLAAMNDVSFAIVALADADGMSVRIANGDLAFSDGRLTGDVGCNLFGADATLADDGVITVTGEIYSTLMFCPDRNDAEQLFGAILRGGGLVFDRTTGVIRGNAGSILLGEKTVAPITNETDDSIGSVIGSMHVAHHRSDSSTLIALLAGVIGGFLAGYATARRQQTAIVAAAAAKPRATRRVRRPRPSVKKTGGAR